MRILIFPMYAIQKKHIGYMFGALFALVLMVPAVLGFSHTANAQALTKDELFGGTQTGEEFASTAGLGSGNLMDTITSIIRIALGFLGIIAVVIILLGGFKWMASGGNEDKVKKAKQLIYSGIIGLVIVLSAYAIASFVIDQLANATAGTGSNQGG